MVWPMAYGPVAYNLRPTAYGLWPTAWPLAYSMVPAATQRRVQRQTSHLLAPGASQAIKPRSLATRPCNGAHTRSYNNLEL